MPPYGDIDLDQHWLRLWLDAWWHRAITWSNVNFFLLSFCGNHMSAISQKVQASINVVYEPENYTFKISATSPRDQWVMQSPQQWEFP